jgi:uncharacterized membrane protein (UPF0136 family)
MVRLIACSIHKTGTEVERMSNLLGQLVDHGCVTFSKLSMYNLCSVAAAQAMALYQTAALTMTTQPRCYFVPRPVPSRLTALEILGRWAQETLLLVRLESMRACCGC